MLLYKSDRESGSIEDDKVYCMSTDDVNISMW